MKSECRIAVILDMQHSYHRRILAGIAAGVRRQKGWTLYAETDASNQLPDLASWRGDGLIVCFSWQGLQSALRGLRIPVVAVEGGYGWYDRHSRIPYVRNDEQATGRLAAEHLLGRGFKRLAYVGVQASPLNAWSRQRGAAFLRRARGSATACSAFPGLDLPTARWEALQRQLSSWLRTLDKPVGIFAANDTRARHVLEACRRNGLRVPDDVAVIGADNDDPLCDLTDPPLTSIELDGYRIGHEALAMLKHLLDGRVPRERAVCIPPLRVVQRQSTNLLAVEDKEVAAAFKLINQGATEGLTIARIVRATGISHSSLAARFLKTVGHTMQEELRRVRISTAHRLVLETQQPLKQIARETGFTHIQHMTNLFRKHLGRAPAQIRRQSHQ